MTTIVDYALLAGAAYFDTRSEINRIPSPKGWDEYSRIPENKDTGFEASAYKKNDGSEIVISFAGTDPGDVFGDIIADLVLAAGGLSKQLCQAAEYYLGIKKTNPNVTFTGHSLGGGVASLMAVFFGESAYTFDQAPFLASALTTTTTDWDGQQVVRSVAQDLYNYLMGKGFKANDLGSLDAFIKSAEPSNLSPVATDTLAVRGKKVININVDGEFLTDWPVIPTFARIGSQADIVNSNQGVGGLDLHSQALLTAFLQSDPNAAWNTDEQTKSLNRVTYKLPDLLEMIFDPELFSYPTNDEEKRNFIEHLVRHEAGVEGSFVPDAMVTRFTADLWKLAQEGGLTMSDGNQTRPELRRVSDALIAFAMQKYYAEKEGSVGQNEEFFTSTTGTGSIRFDMATLSPEFKQALENHDPLKLANAKGFELYFKTYLKAFSEEEQGLINAILPYMRDWYVQAGASGMTVTDEQNRGAFMLGGVGVDQVTGGSADDLLFGNAGDDVLAGGDGNDILLGGRDNDNLKGDDGFDMLVGGAGNDTLDGGKGNDILRGGDGRDTYTFTGTDYGIDVITDSDGEGVIKIDGQTLSNAQQIFESIYKDEGTSHAFVKVNDGKSLVILQEGTDNRIVVNGWSSLDRLGITLQDTTLDTPAATLTGDFKKAIDVKDPANPGDDVYLFENGNYVRDGDEAGALDLISGTAGKDVIDGLGGDDALSGMEGDDYILGGGGNDVIQGGLGKDTIYGDAGSDKIYGSSDELLDKPKNVNFIKPVNDAPYPTGTGFNWSAGYSTTFSNGVPQGYADYPRNRLDNDLGNVIDGGSGDDFIAAGTGADYVHGGAENDYIFGMDKGDVLFGDGDNDVIYGDGDSPSEWSVVWSLPENHGSDVIDGGDGIDYLYGQGKDDIIFGGEGNDRIWGDDDEANLAIAYHGNDFLFGGAGADQIVGGGGNDYLEGGTGNDTIFGGVGDDVYFYNVGDGVDYIVDNKEGEKNILRFGVGVDASKIKLRPGSLMLDLGNGDAVHIENFNHDDVFNSSSIGKFEFSDGTSLTDTELLARGFDIDGTSDNDILDGTNTTDRINGLDGNDQLDGRGGDDVLLGGAGDDTIFGGDGNDVLDGGSGANYLDGGIGEDTYRNVDGDDTIVDADGKSTIEFAENVRAEDIEFVFIDDNGISKLAMLIGNNEVTRIDETQNDGTQKYHFDNGVQLSHQEILGQRLFQERDLTGSTGDDLLHGYAGNDDIGAGYGNDQLFGYDGNDILAGDTGDDVLTGGRGNDVLRGGAGNDVYLFARGDGHDVIMADGGNVGLDIIRFSGDIAQSDVAISHRANGDLLLQLGNGVDQIVVQGWYRDPAHQLQRIEFEDGSFIAASELLNIEALPITGTDGDDSLAGTEFDDVILGRSGADTLDGGAGNDRIEGEDGIDTYILKVGMGMDTVIDTSMQGNVLKLAPGLDFSNLSAKRDGDNLVVRIAGSSDGMVLQNYYTDPQEWTVLNANGQIQDVEQVITATQALEQNKVSAMWQDYLANVRNSTISDYLGQGYEAQMDGTLYRHWSKMPLSEDLRASVFERTTTETTWITYYPDYYNGNTLTTTSTSTNANWNTERTNLFEETAVINTIRTNSDDSVIYTQAQQLSDSSSKLVIAEADWTVRWQPSSQGTSSSVGYIYDDGYGFDVIGTYYKETVYRSRWGNAIGTATDVLPIGSVPIENGYESKYAEVRLFTFSYTLNTEEIYAGASDNVIYGNAYTLVNAGAGNDTVNSAGFAFGGEGDDYLLNGFTLIGGAGNDTLLNAKVLVGGDGDDYMDGGVGATRYIIDPSTTGHDVIVDSGNDDERYRDWYYDMLGVEDIEYRKTYGGKWVLYPGERNREFDSYDEAVAYADEYGWDIEAAQLTYVEPLPAVSMPLANDYADLQPLYDAGLIEQDVVEFESGLSPDDVVVQRTGADSITLSWGEGKQLSINMPTAEDPIGTGIEIFKFHDGTIWNMAELERRAVLPIATSADDMLFGSAYHDAMSGLAGDDYLDGGSGNDTLDGGAGNDILKGGFGSDIYLFGRGSGSDTINQENSGSTDVDIIRFVGGVGPEHVHQSREGNALKLTVIDTGESISQQDWYEPGANRVRFVEFSDGTVWDLVGESLLGSDGNDTLLGTEKDSSIQALAGEDTIYGNAGNDVLDGGAGNDVLNGGSGSDVYLFTRDGGADTIFQDSASATDVDVIRFGIDILPSDVTVSRAGDSLLLTINETGDSLMLADWFINSVHKISRIEFDNGSVWNPLELMRQLRTIRGTDRDEVLVGTERGDILLGFGGDDWIDGGDGNDTLNGGAGEDYLVGGNGDDVYLFGRGHGNDRISNNDHNGGVNTIRFDATVLPADIRVSRDTYDLRLRIVGTADTITICNWYDESYGAETQHIQRVEFADGTVWSDTDLVSKVSLSSSESDDYLVGTDNDDVIHGMAGNDYIVGNSGNDTLYGEAGDDTHEDTSGNDRHDGGAGNDVFLDYDGNDTYYFENGSGWDTIDNYQDEITGPGQKADTIEFGPGVLPEDVAVSDDQEGNLYLIYNDGADRVKVDGWFNNAEKKIERVVFADGTQWNTSEIESRVTMAPSTEYDDEIYAGSGDEVIDGLAGNDTIWGNAGNDILKGGAGDDDIEDWEGSNLLDGGDGKDYLYGDDASNFMIGGTGADYIDSWSSQNVVAFNAGHGEDTLFVGNKVTITLGGGITVGDLSVSKDGENIILNTGGGNRIRIDWTSGLEEGVELPVITLQVIGSDIRTYDFNAVIAVYEAANGGEPGAEWSIEESLSENVLSISSDQVIGGVLAYRYARDGSFAALTMEEVRAILTDERFGVVAQYVEVDVSPQEITGNSSNDVLMGTSDDDRLVGGTGNDSLTGGLGNDTYLFNINDGVDRLVDIGGVDTIEFGSGITADSISLGLGSLLVRYGSGQDAIHIEGFDPNVAESSPIENFRFADGASLTYDQLVARGFDIYGTEQNDNLTGTNLRDRLYGGQGDDQYVVNHLGDAVTENAGEGVDTVQSSIGYTLSDNVENLVLTGAGATTGVGNAQDNVIAGNAANNTLGGGRGDDVLQGGAGDDDYLFRLGDGSDRIIDVQGNNTLHIGSGVTAANLRAERQGNDLILTLHGTTDAVALADWFSATEGVNQIVFDDDTQLDRQGIERLLNRPPVAVADSTTLYEDGGIVNIPVTYPLANDTDPNPGDILTVISVGESQVGASVSLVDGKIEYDIGGRFQQLADGEVLRDSFAYTISDDHGATATSVVQVNIVGTNDAPIATADTTQVTEDGMSTVVGNVLANDSDVDNDTALEVASPGTFVGTYGNLTLAQDGSYSYSLNGSVPNVQSLAAGQVVVDRFAYVATDGIAEVASVLDVAITGTNDAPIVTADTAQVTEGMTVRGNVLANDSDVDAGTSLKVVAPGTMTGTYGGLTITQDGSYTYSVNEDAANRQVLGRQDTVVDRFTYTATDGTADVASSLEVTLHGANDAPILVKPLADQNIKFSKRFSWQMPADSFIDIDEGDTLTYQATLADGSALPSWLTFNVATGTFSGVAPKKVGSLDIRVTATDKVAADGSTEGSLSTSDVFRLSISHGNQGVGNGQDASPNDHCFDFNDGPGTAPGKPGAKGSRANVGMDQDDADGGKTKGRKSGVKEQDAGHSESKSGKQAVPPYLNSSQLEQFTSSSTSNIGNLSSAQAFARWLTVDLAVSAALAEQKSLSWLDDRLGADTTGLSKATAGYLGSTTAFGGDALSLVAGTGKEMKAFQGLGKGVAKIA